jgi:dihydroxy-acid dehydratase
MHNFKQIIPIINKYSKIILKETTKPTIKKYILEPILGLNKYSKILTNDITKGATRAMLYGLKFTDKDFNKALIGIGSMTFDGNTCNVHTGILADHVKYGINHDQSDNLKGLRFTTIGVSDGLTMGTPGMRYSLPSRELIADSIESMICAHYYDGSVIIPSCDKNMPGTLLGLARINRPSIIIYGGSIKPGCYNSELVDIVNAFESYGNLLTGQITNDERNNLLKECCSNGVGSCGGMYTANTMACAIEAMGMCLPYSSSYPADSIEKINECKTIGKYMEKLLKDDIKPSDIITKKSLHNAIVTIIALGGSTNAILHLIALARTIDIKLDLYDFTQIGKNIPLIANMKPFGKYLMYDLHLCGGTPSVLKYLLDAGYLHGDCMTVSGKTIQENLSDIKPITNKQIFDINNPIKKSSHFNIMHGTLAPNGSVGKITGKEGLFFEGIACVYNSEDDFINDLSNHKIKPKSVIIIRYQGPKGGPGMVEMLRATSAIIGYGIKDSIAFLTDGRFSGGSHGFLIGHITPEAYDCGPIALIENGDKITIDTIKNEINHNIPNDIINERRQRWKIPSNIINNVDKYSYLSRYRKLVNSATDGCVLF